MTTYYEVKNGITGQTFFTQYHEQYEGNDGADGADEETADVLTGRTVEIDDSFTVQGDEREWSDEIQARCKKAVA